MHTGCIYILMIVTNEKLMLIKMYNLKNEVDVWVLSTFGSIILSISPQRGADK